MTKEQLLAEFDKNHPKSQHCEYGFDSFEDGLLCDCKTIERCRARKEMGSALDKYGAMEYERGRRDVTEHLFKIESEKWKDAQHCTCLGYALVEISGGEDSKGGEEMEKRLLNIKSPL